MDFNNVYSNILIIRVIIIIILIFLGIFLTYRFNSKSTYCKASVKTQIPHKNSTNTQNKTLNRQNKNSMEGKKQYKRGTRAKTLDPEKKSVYNNLITDVVTPSVNMNQETPDETRHVLARH